MLDQRISHYLYFFSGFILASLLFGSFFLGTLTSLSFPVVVVEKHDGSAPQKEGERHEQTVRTIEQKTSPLPSPKPVASSAEQVFAKEFENLLNGFLKELVQATTEYKKDRRILKEVVDPYNVEGTENAEKSYKTFRDDIAPMLRKKGQSVIDIFANTEKVIKALLSDKPKDVQDKLFSSWSSLKKEQMSGLVDFFETEEKLLEAHEKLLKFYFVHSKLYSVDPSSGAIVFSNAKYKAEEGELLNDIQELRQPSSD